MNDAGKVHQIEWQAVCPWLLLIRCLRVALMIRVLFLGAIGLIVVTAGWQLISSFFDAANDPALSDWKQTGCEWVWSSTSHFTVSPTDMPDSAQAVFAVASTGLLDAPVAVWSHLTRPFVDMFRADLTASGFVCLVLCGIWEVLVWALLGGVIARIAALYLTRSETPDFFASLRHAAGRIVSYSAAPLMALAAAAVFALVLLVLGATMRADVLAMLAGLAWPFVLVLGALMAILLIGVLVGWPLMWATIAVENTDAFDALSRSYAYTYQRPLRLLWYVLFGTLLGALGMFAVKFFALATIGLGDWSISWALDDQTLHYVVDQQEWAGGDGPPPLDGEDPVPTSEPGALLDVAAGAVGFWKSLLAALVAGYQVGYLWSAAVGIYLLLRHDIDAAELDEVFVDDEEPDYGLPSLQEDESGVPEVAPTAAAQPGDAAGDAASATTDGETGQKPAGKDES